MLANGPIVPILPAVDMERAKRFYQEKLGLKLVADSEEGCILECGDGSRLFIYPHEATKADHTVAGFDVDDVETQVRELRAKGVVFEEYDTPGLKTVDGIATMGEMKGAWFKDSEGNIIGVSNVGRGSA